MNSPRSASRLFADLIDAQRDSLLEEWVDLQLEDESIESDPFDREELHSDSARLLDLLRDALREDESADIHGAGFADVRKLLDRIAQRRAERGLTASETATFFLSLKQPLMVRVRQDYASDRLADDLWEVIQLVDQLGLYVTQVYQRSRDAVIARQQAEMIELSTPVIRLWDGILALPIVGTLDTGRSLRLTEGMLGAISSTGAQVAIIDLTGVPAVDTRMAQHLLRTAAAARLMGATCILCGIRPQIAQTMVHLQIDFEGLETVADMASALQLALRRVGLQIEANGSTRPPSSANRLDRESF